jgi:exodeoxyribonuclease VII large subunit
MRQQGEGDLYKRFLLLKDRLQSEGLFDTDHKKQIPFLPHCVGVITSKTGAVFHDIENVIRRRYPKMNIVLCPAKVQGDGAADEISEAISFMNKQNIADVLIVGRGGGSLEDLWAFNEEKTARAIYGSRIPVISAVGHETDFTIADFTADLRAPTPSAAAELCVPEYCEFVNRVRGFRSALQTSAKAGLDARREKVMMIGNSRGFSMPFHKLQNERQRLDGLNENLSRNICAALSSRRQDILRFYEKLGSLDPSNVLKRGYTLARTKDGSIADTISALYAGESLELVFQDGSADITVEGIINDGGTKGE